VESTGEESPVSGRALCVSTAVITHCVCVEGGASRVSDQMTSFVCVSVRTVSGRAPCVWTTVSTHCACDERESERGA